MRYTVIRSMFSRVFLLPEPLKQTSAFITDAMGITQWHPGRVHDLKCTYDFGERCFSSSACVHSDASVFSVRQLSRLITCSPFGSLDVSVWFFYPLLGCLVSNFIKTILNRCSSRFLQLGEGVGKRSTVFSGPGVPVYIFTCGSPLVIPGNFMIWISHFNL